MTRTAAWGRACREVYLVRRGDEWRGCIVEHKARASMRVRRGFADYRAALRWQRTLRIIRALELMHPGRGTLAAGDALDAAQEHLPEETDAQVLLREAVRVMGDGVRGKGPGCRS